MPDDSMLPDGLPLRFTRDTAAALLLATENPAQPAAPGVPAAETSDLASTVAPRPEAAVPDQAAAPSAGLAPQPGAVLAVAPAMQAALAVGGGVVTVASSAGVAVLQPSVPQPSVLLASVLLSSAPAPAAVNAAPVQEAAAAAAAPVLPDAVITNDASPVSLAEITGLLSELQSTLGLIESGLENKAFAESLPLIGNQLGAAFTQGQAAVQAFQTLDNKIITALNSLEALGSAEPLAVVQTALNGAISAAGFSNHGTAILDGSGNLVVDLFDSASLASFSTPLGGNFGVPGLNFDTQGTAKTALTYGLNVAATVTPSGAVSTPTGSLDLGLDVTAPHFSGDATFGPLKVTAADNGSSLSGDVTLDTAGKVTFGGTAALNVNLASDLGGGALPGVSTDLVVNWPFSNTNTLNPANETQLGGVVAPTVTLENVAVDLGTFVTNMVKPVLDDLNQIIQPFQPIIQMLTEPIAPIMALPKIAWQLFDFNNDGTVNLLDFLDKENGSTGESTFDKVVKLLGTITTLDQSFNSLGGPGGQFGLGTFTFPTGADIRSSAFNLSTVDPSDVGATTVNQLLGTLSGALGVSMTSLLTQSSDGSGFNFPILNDPSQAIRMLLGGNANLVTYQLPETQVGVGTIDSNGDVTNATTLAAIPLFPGVNFNVTAALAGQFGLQFGLDTSGLQAYAKGGYSDPSKILDGLYLANPFENGVQVPMITVGADIGIGVSAGGFGTDAEGEGDVSGVLNIGLANGGTEYLGNLLNLLQSNPLALLDASGRVTAGLDFQVNVAGANVFGVASPRVVLYPPAGQRNSASNVPTQTVWAETGDSDFETSANWNPTFATVGNGLANGTWDLFADTTIDPSALGFSLPANVHAFYVTFNGPLEADLYSLQEASNVELDINGGTLLIDGASALATNIAGTIDVSTAAGALLKTDFFLSGDVNNTGTIFNDAADIGVAGVLDLTGRGAVTGRTQDATWTVGFAPSVHLGALLRNDDNLIDGMGHLDVAFANSGQIAADIPGSELFIDHDGRNSGFMDAGPAPSTLFGDGGTLVLNNVSIDNTGGTISAIGTGTVFLGSSVVYGTGISTTIHGGTLAVTKEGSSTGSIEVRNVVTLDGGTIGLAIQGLVEAIPFITPSYIASQSAIILSGLITSATYGSAPGANGIVANGNATYLDFATIRGGVLDARLPSPANPALTQGITVDSTSTLDGSQGAAGVAIDGTLDFISKGTLAIAGGIVPALDGGAIETNVNGSTIIIGIPGNDTATLGRPVAGSVAGTQGTLLLDGAGNTITPSDATAMLTNNWHIIGSGLINSGLANTAVGTVEATSAGLLLALSSGTLVSSNAGLLEADAGSLLLIDSTLNNAGGTILANGGNVALRHYSAAGGTLQTANGGSIDLLFNETLDGSAAPLTLASGAHVVLGTAQSFSGAIVNHTSLALVGDGASGTADLAIPGGATLSGGGTLMLSDTSGNAVAATQIINGTHIGDVLDNIDNTITGYGIIGAGGLGLINESGGTITAHGGTLTIGAYFTNRGVLDATTGSTLLLTGAVTDTGSSVVASGGTVIIAAALAGGALAVSHGGSFLVDFGGLDGRASPVTIPSAVTLEMQAGLPTAGQNTLTVQGAIANSGTIVLQADSSMANARHTLLVAGTASLRGGGLISMSDLSSTGVTAADAIQGTSGTDTLDNVDNRIIGFGTVGAGSMSLTNEAAGIIETLGGALFLDVGGTGSQSANAGLIEALGNTIDLTGTITNTGGTIAARNDGTGDSGVVLLDGADLLGGTLLSDPADIASGFTVTTSGATLDGTADALTLAASTQLAIVPGAQLSLAGSIDNGATAALRADSAHSHASTILVAGTVSLSGGGLIRMSDTLSTGVASAIVTGSSGADTLDNIDNSFIGIGRFGNAAMSLRNETAGLIEAAGGTLVLQMAASGTAINKGTLAARGGTLDLLGIIANAGGTIAALNDGTTSGVVLIDGATIQGGTLASDTADVASQLQTTAANGTLDGTASPVTVAAQAHVEVIPGSHIVLTGTLVDQGTITELSTSGHPVYIQIVGDATIKGTGSIVLTDGSGAGSFFYQVLTGTSYANTLDTAGIISGVGQIGNRYYNDDLTLINETGGTISANSANGGTLVVDTGTVAIANTGLLTTAPSGTLDLTSNVTNIGGTIAATGSGVTQLLRIAVTGGTFSGTDGGLVISSDATIDATGSTVTLKPGAQVGVLPAYTNYLELEGNFANSGTLFVSGNSQEFWSALYINGSVRLTGGGRMALIDNEAQPGFGDSYISGSSGSNPYMNASNTLDNVDNHISGSGVLGNVSLAITNEAAGVIEALGGALSIITASGNSVPTNGRVVNHGTILALGEVLYINSVIDNRGGTVEARNDGAGHSGTVDLHGAYFQGGSFLGDPSDPGSVIVADNYGGTLDGTTQAVTLGAGSPILVPKTGSLELTGSIVNHGTLVVSAVSGYGATVGIAGTASLSGGGRVSMTDAGLAYDDRIYGSTGADTLDNIDNTIVGLGELGFEQTSIINEAAGTIVAQGGTLLFDPSGPGTTVTNLGLLGALGGTLYVRSDTISNGGTIAARNDGAGHSGIVALYGSDILGGVFSGDTSDPQSVIEATSNATTLDGSATAVTLDATSRLQIGTGQQSGTVELLGRIVAQSTIALESDQVYGTALLEIGGSVSLGGGGTVNFALPDGYHVQEIDGAAKGATLDNTGVTITGTGQIGVLNLSFTNEAAGVVNTAGGAILINTSTNTVVNHGSLGATAGGQLEIRSSVANLGGTIGGIGGVVLINGDYLSAGATIAAGTLTGTIDSFDGAIDGTTNAVTILPGATVAISATVPNDYDKTLTLAGSIVNHGTLLVQGSDAGVGTPSHLLISGQARLSGDGTLQLTGLNAGDHGSETVVLAAAAGATLDNADNLITGFGTLGLGGLPIIDEAAGIIRAAGGTLDVPGPVTGAGILAVTPGAALQLRGSIGAGLSIHFAGGGGGETVAIGQPLAMGGTIEGFFTGTTIDLLNVQATQPNFAGGVLQLLNGTVEVAALDFGEAHTAGDFLLQSDHNGGTDIVATGTSGITNAPCFAEGTSLLTTRGEVAVESLRIGDIVVTTSGRLRPVRWIGLRETHCARHPNPQDVMPVRIQAHAFGPSAPHRDLYLSPDHAVFADGDAAAGTPGVLIPIRYLVNGRSVAQLQVTRVTYYHVELEAHDVILAEGLPCESYLDTGNRAAFANAEGAVMQHPDFALAVWRARACAELVCDGPRLAAVRRLLLSAAASLGHSTTTQPDLRVMAAGRALPAEVVPLGGDRSRWRVRVPVGVDEVLLRSRSGIPAELQPGSSDIRRLGVAIGAVALDGGPLRLDAPQFAEGWHAPEPEWRWTNGEAKLHLSKQGELTFDVVLGGHYWIEPGVDQPARPARSRGLG